MIIGIVTQSLANNYGGILQNYALQSCLRKLGHSPITIDYKKPPISYFSYLYLCLRTLASIFWRFKNQHFPRRDINRRGPKMEAFVNRHIEKTKLVEKYYVDLIEEYNIQALIVGSDQVWRPEYNYSLEDMYLRFAEKVHMPKIAYAASFGVDEWEYSQKQTDICRKLIKQFNFISVREASGIQLCKKYLDTEAVEMIDPTLLLTKEEYEILCENVSKSEENILAAYVLDLNAEISRFIEEFAASNHLKTRMFRADQNCSLSIEEWLAMFRDSQYIVTDSFHGTIFSIIFNKPFISISNKGRGSSRFQNLLSKFNLDDRLVTNLANQQLNLREINWGVIMQKIGALRNTSYTYLNTYIK